MLLAATNRPEILDPALLRAGRIDRQVLIDRPDRKGRQAILKVHLQKITVDKALDSERIADITTGFTGADLANLVNEAAIVATCRGADTVGLDDFTAAVERLIAGIERKSSVLRPKNARWWRTTRWAMHWRRATRPWTRYTRCPSCRAPLARWATPLQRPTEDHLLISCRRCSRTASSC